MDRSWLDGFVQACDLATQVMDDDAVAQRWPDASALRGFTVGGVAGHLYGAIRRFEVALDEDLAARPRVLDLAELYGRNRVDQPDDIDAGWHPLIREDAERRAAYGPAAVASRFRDVVSRLSDRLPQESPERLVPVWTVPSGVTRLRVYAATRVVELVVHADDLAISAGLEPLPVPRAAATAAIEVFVEMARYRSGDLDVIRAFARTERAPGDALRVL